MMLKETDYHTDWQKNRVKFILNEYPLEFFKGKRVLELGSCNGYIGACMHELGADVLCIEGREENVTRIKRDFPHLKCEILNLDTDNWTLGKWDIIINFGLYYHLETNHEAHLRNCLTNCNMMFFETVVHDNYEPMIWFRQEYGFDQSLSGKGGAPTQSYVEDIFNSMNVSYRRYDDASLNGGEHHYDWIETNSNIEDIHRRRFWIVNINS